MPVSQRSVTTRQECAMPPAQARRSCAAGIAQLYSICMYIFFSRVWHVAICALILLYTCPHTMYTCLHTTTYMSSYFYIRVLLLLCMCRRWGWSPRARKRKAQSNKKKAVKKTKIGTTRRAFLGRHEPPPARLSTSSAFPSSCPIRALAAP